MIKTVLNKWILHRDKKRRLIVGAVCLFVIIILISILLWAAGAKDQSVYRESQVIWGTLSVGVTESGNVSIGISAQSFDIDLSEYSGNSSTSSNVEAAGGNFMQMMPEEAAASTESRLLEVEEVFVEAGEEITVGAPLLSLTQSSVNNIRRKLEEDADSAKLVYDQTQTGQEQVVKQAESDLKVDKAYGEYAQSEYDKAIYELEQTVAQYSEKIAEQQEELETQTNELAQKKELLATQKEVLENARYAQENTDREEALYWWIVAVNTVRDTEELTDTLEEEIETAQTQIEELEQQIKTDSIQLSLANKDLATGKIAARTTLELRSLESDKAEEIYDVTVAQSSFETECAKEDYQEAKERLDAFDSLIQDHVICSAYDGLITKTGVENGDGLSLGTEMVTLNDYGEAAVIVTVEEADIESAQPGNDVNIVLNAYPEQVFKGEVEQIGDAEINSNTNTTTYSVTVIITEDIGGIYEGMSAEVTFITKESEEVLYVSNRAIIRDSALSYVKIRRENGDIVKQEVVTGFSDGVNVEVTEGLKEGDTILIESNVNDSKTGA